MNIEILIPVGTLIIGWLLNESSNGLQLRKRNKEALSCVITDLLEIRHVIKTISILFNEVQVRLDISEQDLAQLKVLIGSILPKQEALHKRYDESVTQLAKSNPMLAFELRNKNMILPYLENLERLVVGDIDTLTQVKKMEKKLYTIIIPDLEKAIKRLSFKFGFITYCRIWRLFRKPASISGELEEMLDDLENALNSEELNKSIQPTTNASAD